MYTIAFMLTSNNNRVFCTNWLTTVSSKSILWQIFPLRLPYLLRVLFRSCWHEWHPEILFLNKEENYKIIVRVMSTFSFLCTNYKPLNCLCLVIVSIITEGEFLFKKCISFSGIEKCYHNVMILYDNLRNDFMLIMIQNYK